MINKRFVQSLKKQYEEQVSQRQEIIARSNKVLHQAKRIIFALQRGQTQTASKMLALIEAELRRLAGKFGSARLRQEGAYNAAAEEYVEAKMFWRLAQGKKISKIKAVNVSLEAYLGGLCDVTGELVRRATNAAAAGDLAAVSEIKKIITDIMAELAEFNLTGYFRTKYDQAYRNLRKIEQMDYEIKLKLRQP